MSKNPTSLSNITTNNSALGVTNSSVNSSLSLATNTRHQFAYANNGGGDIIPLESLIPKQALTTEQIKYAIENVKSLGVTVERDFVQYFNIISGFSEYNSSDLSRLINYASKSETTFKQCIAQMGHYISRLEISMVVESLNYILEHTNQKLPLQLLTITPHFKHTDVQAIIDCFKLVDRINTNNYIDFSPSSIKFT